MLKSKSQHSRQICSSASDHFLVRLNLTVSAFTTSMYPVTLQTIKQEFSMKNADIVTRELHGDGDSGKSDKGTKVTVILRGWGQSPR